jgi:hypothetical protein
LGGFAGSTALPHVGSTPIRRKRVAELKARIESAHNGDESNDE